MMVENFSAPKQNAITWPTLLDYTKIDCQRILRRLELEAYAKIVTVFRAQGPLTGEKRKTLQDLQRLLSIASDRHKAEVRRALNDEELATICESICGKEADDAWILEGKRIAPLLDRGIPQTAFLPRANLASAKWAEFNSKLPRPFDTTDKEEEPGRDTDWIRSDERRSPTTGENIASPVPEAAMEVTCEADTSKATSSQSETEKNTNENVPIGCTEHTGSLPDHSTTPSSLVDTEKHMRSEETLSKSMFTLSSTKTSATKDPTGLIQPTNGCQPYAPSNAEYSSSAKKRIYGLPSQPRLSCSDEAPNNRPPISLSTVSLPDQNKPDEHGRLSNGVIPMVTQSRGMVFGPSSNVISSPVSAASPSNNSQAPQMAKFLGTSCASDETMTSRHQHSTNTVFTGSSGTPTLVPQQSVVTTSPGRLMKTHIFHPQQPQQIYSYTSFANTVPVVSGSVAHLSAPSLLSDSKRQPVVIQQTGGASTSGNVIVVHRGASGRLIAGAASSAIHGGGITHTASTAVASHQPSSTVVPITGATTSSGRPLRILSVPASIMSASSNTYTPTFHQTFSVSQRTTPSMSGANPPETPLSNEQGIYYYVTNPQPSSKNLSPVKPRSSAPVALKVFEAPAPPVPPSTLPAVDLDAECPERERTAHSPMTPDKPVRAESSSVEKQPLSPAVSCCSVNILTVPGVLHRSPISVGASAVVSALSTAPAVPVTVPTVMTSVPVRPAHSKPAESAACAPVSLVSVLEPKRPRVAFVPSSQPL
uniref:ENT domain-containing protein n=1 Tax=Schistocephalus solidus TaxID=70667 RepID=A0A0X3P2P7_SCHSO